MYIYFQIPLNGQIIDSKVPLFRPLKIKTILTIKTTEMHFFYVNVSHQWDLFIIETTFYKYHLF